MKLSTGKSSLPGGKQIFRRYDVGGKMAEDVIGLEEETSEFGEPLLALAMSDGQRTMPPSPIDAARQRVADGLAALPQEYKRLREPSRYPVSLSPGLQRLDSQTRSAITAGQSEGA